MTSRKRSVFKQRAASSIAISVLTFSQAHALTIGTFDAHADLAKEKNVIEATVVSSQIHTFNVSGKIFSCGESFQLIVSDILAGDAPKIVEVTQTLSSPEDLNFGNVERDRRTLNVGRKYLLGFKDTNEHRKADYYPKHGSIEAVWPVESKSAASKSCFSKLPANKLMSAFEVVQDQYSPHDSESPNHEYVFLGWTRSASPELYDMAIGAEAKFSYIRTDKINLEARAYLENFGRHTPENYAKLLDEEAELYPEIDRSEVKGKYLEEVGRNGNYLLFDFVFPYDKFKRLLIERIDEVSRNRPRDKN